MAVPVTRPRSEAQRAAARRNGARSRGPISEAGKARASRNALRHGLCAATHLVAQGEDPTELEALLAELRAEHRPRTPSEDVLVHRLAVVVWKLARCDRLEAALMDSRPRPPAGRVYAEPGVPAFLTRPAELGVLLRHEAQLQRELHRLLRALAARPRRVAARWVPAEPAAAAPSPAARPAPAAPEPASVARDVQNEPEPGAAVGQPTASARTPSAPDPCARARPASDRRASADPAPAASADGFPAGQPPWAPSEPIGPADSAAAERTLLGRAAARPELARSLLEHLLEEGELARFARLASALGPAVLAAVDLRGGVG